MSTNDVNERGRTVFIKEQGKEMESWKWKKERNSQPLLGLSAGGYLSGPFA